jgi:Domain of unknown function (DUF929)
MSKADRKRQQQTARERIAAQQAAAKRAEKRRRYLFGGGITAVVLVVVLVLILVKALGGHSTPSQTSSAGGTAGTPLPASVLTSVTTVPATVSNKVGTGPILSLVQQPVTSATGPLLTSNGKPEMLYIGAEFCPYCAAMRWSMAVALSNFGTMSPLHGIHSSGSDAYPNTATLTFYKSSYTSKYLTFTPVENQTITHAALQPTTAAQNAIWAKYEPDANTRGYPFIDIGNRYLIKGPIYNPQVLAGLTWQQIAADLHNPSSPVAQSVLGAANFITAAICKVTNAQSAGRDGGRLLPGAAGGRGRRQQLGGAGTWFRVGGHAAVTCSATGRGRPVPGHRQARQSPAGCGLRRLRRPSARRPGRRAPGSALRGGRRTAV